MNAMSFDRNAVSLPAPRSPSTIADVTVGLRKRQALICVDCRDQYYLRVLRGALRVVRPLADGRRQITDFLFPGDWLGLDEVREYNASIEAVVASRLELLSPRSLEFRAAQDGADAVGPESLFKARLHAAQDRILVLGRKNARQKLAAFLLEISDRLAEGGNSISLPMSRCDIGDYLCLTAETVCRNFSQLVADGIIALPSASQVRVLRRNVLEFIGSDQ